MNRYMLSADVQKALKDRGLTADEVIRKALDIRVEGLATIEGVFFPEGTTFLTWYKDVPHMGIVRSGVIVIAGEEFSSVSGAAARITGRPTQNGWQFWMVKLPGKNEVVPISNFRKQ